MCFAMKVYALIQVMLVLCLGHTRAATDLSKVTVRRSYDVYDIYFFYHTYVNTLFSIVYNHMFLPAFSYDDRATIE